MKQNKETKGSSPIPPYNYCRRCYNGYELPSGKILKSGVYSEITTYLHFKDKPNEEICKKCICLTCGHIPQVEDKKGNRGFFYERIAGGDLINTDIKNWYIVKKYNLNAKELENLLFENPKRNSFTLEELPKNKAEEKPQFYEPVEEISEQDIPF